MKAKNIIQKDYYYYFEQHGKKYKVCNFYVESTTYNATMVHLTFEQALKNVRFKKFKTKSKTLRKP